MCPCMASFLCTTGTKLVQKHSEINNESSTNVQKPLIQSPEQPYLRSWITTILLIWSHHTGLTDKTQPCFSSEQSEHKGTRSSARSKLNRFNLVLFTTPVLSTTHKMADPISKLLTSSNSKTPHRRKSLSFRSVYY